MVKKFSMLFLVLLGIIALFVGTAAAEEVKAPAGFPMTIELESFKLTNGNIVENKDASDGKAVVATSLQFMATKVVNFKEKGVYELTLTENAPNGATDAINVRLNGAPGLRIYPDENFAGKFTNCLKKVPIVVKEPGDITIDVFTSNEMGAMYDKVTIAYVKPL